MKFCKVFYLVMQSILINTVQQQETSVAHVKCIKAN